MSFVGNRKGLRRSEIVQKLGPDYFGISLEENGYYLEGSIDEIRVEDDD